MTLDDIFSRASRSPRYRPRFYEALLREELWTPGERSGQDLLLQPYNVYGRSMLLAFTRPERASGLRDRPPMILLPGRTFLQAALAFDGAVLNHGNAVTKEFILPEIRALLNGDLITAIDPSEPASEIVIGQPVIAPVAFIAALVSALPKRHEVELAYMAQVGGDGKEHIVIAFDSSLAGEALDRFLDNVRRMAADLGAADVVEVMPIGDDPVSEYMQRETDAIYRKGST